LWLNFTLGDKKWGGRARGRCKWDLSKGLIILGKKSTKITIFEGGKKKRKKSSYL
jgi:hypothetical protein